MLLPRFQGAAVDGGYCRCRSCGGRLLSSPVPVETTTEPAPVMARRAEVRALRRACRCCSEREHPVIDDHGAAGPAHRRRGRRRVAACRRSRSSSRRCRCCCRPGLQAASGEGAAQSTPPPAAAIPAKGGRIAAGGGKRECRGRTGVLDDPAGRSPIGKREDGLVLAAKVQRGFWFRIRAVVMGRPPMVVVPAGCGWNRAPAIDPVGAGSSARQRYLHSRRGDVRDEPGRLVDVGAGGRGDIRNVVARSVPVPPPVIDALEASAVRLAVSNASQEPVAPLVMVKARVDELVMLPPPAVPVEFANPEPGSALRFTPLSETARTPEVGRGRGKVHAQRIGSTGNPARASRREIIDGRADKFACPRLGMVTALSQSGTIVRDAAGVCRAG